ncbi:MAG: regulatory iron-sulfur-containing complex subunit RicT [Syntrophales bacterium]|nr:regulatory iron-sulfur-containing complex subunit RicT [Syntrophales bacterium]
MKNIVGVKFARGEKVYLFNAANLPLKKNDEVIVNTTENGPEIGRVVTEVRSVPLYKAPINLQEVIRKITGEDLRIKEDNQKLEQAARQFFLEKSRARDLPMKLIAVKCFFDKSKIMFYFTAENRVDFREIVKDLAQKFKTKIELRQIGARQEACIIKGIGVCGREVCCASLQDSPERVSIKMAKEQGVSLNIEKISGLCGRLMCCMAFEYDAYQDMKKNMPKCGKMLQTAAGYGKVVRQNVLRGESLLELENGKEITVTVEDM